MEISDQDFIVVILTNGEEIVGKKIKHDHVGITLNEPLKIICEISDEGEVSIFMMRYAPFVYGRQVTIYNNQVVAAQQAANGIRQKYKWYCKRFDELSNNSVELEIMEVDQEEQEGEEEVEAINSNTAKTIH